MGALDDFGVSAEQLADMSSSYNYPKPVPGRVVHIDADFLSYQVSAESKAELDPEDPTPRKSLEDMQHNAKMAVEHIMRLGAGTDYHLHTTPSGSTKGGRDKQAALKEYQANRKDRDGKPEFLDHIRAWLVSELGCGGRGTAHLDQEADDGMAQAAWQAHVAGDSKLCVVASKDKDLRMVPGFMLIDDTVGTFKGTFGSIEIDDSKSSKKVVGRGTKFFWAQLLMGDSADHISGLPEITGQFHMAVKPTKKYIELIKKFADAENGSAASERLDAQIKAILAKRKSVGPVMAYELLKDVDNDRDAYHLIKGMWVDLHKQGYVFEHWRTGKVLTPTQAMASDMMLLWMRRNKNPKDVFDWVKETCL